MSQHNTTLSQHCPPTTLSSIHLPPRLLAHMTDPSSATCLRLAAGGERLAVILNNLGGTSKLEELVIVVVVVALVVAVVVAYLADPSEARGCSINSQVIN